MRNIATDEFVFNTRLDKFYLTNLTDNPLPYKLTMFVGSTETVIEDNLVGVPVATKAEIKIIADGRYMLTVASSNVYFENWLQLRNYILPIVETTLRPCVECQSVKDIDYLTPNTKDAIEAQYLYNLLETYKCSLVDYNTDYWLTSNTTLSDFLFEAANTNRPSTMPMLRNQMLKAAMDGTAVNDPVLYRWYISFIYLGMYSYDREDINTSSSSEETALKTIYNFDIVTSYITKLGMDVLTTLSLY